MSWHVKSDSEADSHSKTIKLTQTNLRSEGEQNNKNKKLNVRMRDSKWTEISGSLFLRALCSVGLYHRGISNINVPIEIFQMTARAVRTGIP